MTKKDDNDAPDGSVPIHSAGSTLRSARRLVLMGEGLWSARRLVLIGKSLCVAFALFLSRGTLRLNWEEVEDRALTKLPSESSSGEHSVSNGQQNSSYPELSLDSLRRRRALSDAVNSMRCMLHPGCYPDVPCADDQKPMKLPQGKTWEQHSLCTGDLAVSAAKAQEKQEKCLVYSFGVHDSTDWERKMAREFGCDVFAFDPTSKFDTNVADGVTFHKLGLQGAGVDVSQTHSELYDAIDPTLLRTLGDIRKMLGHEERQVDVLRLDCEGCEWGVVKQLACSEDSDMVDQLMVEMHFQKNLGIATDDDMLIAADAIVCLEQSRWGLVSMEFSGCDPVDAEYIPSMLKIIKDEILFMLMYATFRRLPVEGQLYKPSDPGFTGKFTERQVYPMKPKS